MCTNFAQHPLYRDCNTMKELRIQNSLLKEAATCVICKDQPRTKLILPCSHLVVCHYCILGIYKCPYKIPNTNKICNCKVRGIVTVFR